jgi:hypothetical protein
VPDGAHNNEILDPIWLNMWKPEYAPGDNTMQGNGTASGGGGCSGVNAAAVFAALILASSAAAVWRRVLKREKL